MALSENQNQTGLGGQPDIPVGATVAQEISHRIMRRSVLSLSMQHIC
jgi:hypothetical protein